MCFSKLEEASINIFRYLGGRSPSFRICLKLGIKRKMSKTKQIGIPDFNFPRRSVANIPQRQQQSMRASSRHVLGRGECQNLAGLYIINSCFNFCTPGRSS